MNLQCEGPSYEDPCCSPYRRPAGGLPLMGLHKTSFAFEDIADLLASGYIDIYKVRLLREESESILFNGRPALTTEYCQAKPEPSSQVSISASYTEKLYRKSRFGCRPPFHSFTTGAGWPRPAEIFGRNSRFSHVCDH